MRISGVSRKFWLLRVRMMESTEFGDKQSQEIGPRAAMEAMASMTCMLFKACQWSLVVFDLGSTVYRRQYTTVFGKYYGELFI